MLKVKLLQILFLSNFADFIVSIANIKKGIYAVTPQKKVSYEDIANEKYEITTFSNFNSIIKRKLNTISDITNKLNSTSVVSNQLQTIIDNNAGSNVFNKAENVIVQNILMKYSINNNETVRVKLRNLNSQYGTDLFEINQVVKNNKILREGRDFYVNYTLNETVYYSKKYDNQYNSSFIDDYIVGCNYNSHSLTYDYKEMEAGNFEEIVKFRLGAFGISNLKNSIYYIKYSTVNKIEIEPAYKYLEVSNSKILMNETKYSKLYVIDQPYEEKSYLVGLTDSSILVFYELIINKFGELNAIYFHTEFNPFYVNTSPIINNSTKNITKIGIIKDRIIIGTTNGLDIYLKKEKNITKETDKLPDKIKEIDNTDSSMQEEVKEIYE